MFIYNFVLMITKQRVGKSPKLNFGVNKAIVISKWLQSNKVGFNGLSYLIYIVDRYKSVGCYSTYTGVYDYFYSTRSGARFRLVRRTIDKMANKGLITIDSSQPTYILLPTDKALLEIGKFL